MVVALPRRRHPKGDKPAKASPTRKEAEARARAAAAARARPAKGPRQATGRSPAPTPHRATPGASGRTGPARRTGPPGEKRRPRTRRRKKDPGIVRRGAARLAAGTRAVWGSDADPTWFRTLFEPVPRHPRPVRKPFAVVILLLNLFPFPGLGTVLYGKWERGIAQFLLTFLFLIGWVWAVSDGIVIVRTAWRHASGPRPGVREGPPRPREREKRPARRGGPPPRRSRSPR